jgi:hypothetical protein
MKIHQHQSKQQRQKISWILTSIFLVALLMGPGPGIYLVNDFAADGGRILGIPILYVWAIFWFAVEAIVILVAYLFIWKDDEV